MIDSLIRHIRSLVQHDLQLATADTQLLGETLRCLTSVVVIVGYECLIHLEAASKRAPLLDAYLDLTQAMQQRLARDAIDETLGSLLLSLGAMGQVAQQIDRQSDRDRLGKFVRKLIAGAPRAELEQWRNQHADRADTLLSSSTGRDLYEPLAQLIERLVGYPSPLVQAQIRDKWGLLLELQRADTTQSPATGFLLAAASEDYKGSWVWDQYKLRRANNQFPIIHEAQDERRCPRCHLGLSMAESSRLRRGDAVKCQNGHIILLRA
jgi:hypothetical protein